MNGTFYLVGGNDGARDLASMEAYHPREVAWAGSNPSVATISATGLVTAGATPGTTTITVTSGGVTGRATLRVAPNKAGAPAR